ncbi:MAG: hypothetical protein ACK50A_09645 [Sphingobacteriaceae bacterium]|jgi:hypothetical protein
MKLFVNLLFFISVLVLSNSCTIQKRNYQKGYYVSYDKKKSRSKESTAAVPSVEKQNEKTEDVKITEYVSAGNKADAFFKNYKYEVDRSVDITDSFINPEDSCGDTLILVNRNEFIIKVIRIDGDKVEYKSCTYLDGPTNVMKLDNIWNIKFKDGRIMAHDRLILKDLERNKCRDYVYFRSGVSEPCHIIEETEKYVTYETCDKQEPVKKINKLRITRIQYADPTKNKIVVKPNETHQIYENTKYPTSLKTSLTITFLFLITLALSVIAEMPVFVILSAVFYITSIATGLSSLNQILENPEKYKGKYLAYANLAITLLPIALVLFIGFLFFLLIFPFFYIGGWHN